MRGGVLREDRKSKCGVRAYLKCSTWARIDAPTATCRVLVQLPGKNVAACNRIHSESRFQDQDVKQFKNRVGSLDDDAMI